MTEKHDRLLGIPKQHDASLELVFASTRSELLKRHIAASTETPINGRTVNGRTPPRRMRGCIVVVGDSLLRGRDIAAYGHERISWKVCSFPWCEIQNVSES